MERMKNIYSTLTWSAPAQVIGLCGLLCDGGLCLSS